MTIELPDPVARYLQADARADTTTLADYFAANAIVRDESRTIQGLDGIKAWKADAHAKYDYTVEPLDAVVDGETLRMPARLTGNFPGSPIEVEYTFTLVAGKITELTIE